MVLLAGCVSGPEPASVDTSAWTQVGDVDWRITDSSIAAGPAESFGFLVSPERYRDVVVSLEFRIDDGTNSGIFVRCRDAATITPIDCFELNIFDNHPNQDFRTGSVVTRQPPLAHVETLGRWNTMRVEVRRDLVTVTVNGIETARLEDGSLDEGHVALQYAGTGGLEFRNLRLEAR